MSDTGAVMAIGIMAGLQTLPILLFFAGWAATTKRGGFIGWLLWLIAFWLLAWLTYEKASEMIIVYGGQDLWIYLITVSAVALLIFNAIITAVLVLLTANGNGNGAWTLALFIWIGVVVLLGIYIGFELPQFTLHYVAILGGSMLLMYLLRAPPA